MKLNELITEFLSAKNRSTRTIKMYVHDLHLLNRWFGDVDVRTITLTNLNDFLGALKVGDSSKARFINTYSSFWNYCHDLYQVPLITKYVQRPKTKTVKFSSLTEGEISRYVLVCRKDTPRNAFLCLLPLFCGLRVGELKNLTLKQVDADFVYDVEGKSKSLRTIPFPDTLKRDAVRFFKWRQLLDLFPASPLFINDEGGNLNEKTIYRIINKNLIRAGVSEDRAHPHALRHTYAMLALKHIGEKEKNPSKALTDVSRLMGHAYIGTTMQYIKPSKEELKKSIREIMPNV